MKAIVQDEYGPPDSVLQLRDVEVPEVGEDEVLIRVRATCVHPDVWHVVTGRPYVLRLMGAGLWRPKNPIPGMDVAGIVESVGQGVTRFQPGDEVFGETFTTLRWANGGAFAEYASVSQDALALKPRGIGFEPAASVPTSGYIALLNLGSGELVQPGHSVLINGAGGGVGTIAVQLAKAYGARVTGVDSTEKLDMIRSLGADHVIDYTRESFLERDERYDLVFDVASNLSLEVCKPALTPTGVYVFIGHDHFGEATGPVLGSLPRAIKLLVLSRFVDHLPRLSSPMPRMKDAMATLAKLLDEGKLTPILDRTYPLDDAPEAMRYLQSGRACGKIVIAP